MTHLSRLRRVPVLTVPAFAVAALLCVLPVMSEGVQESSDSCSLPGGLRAALQDRFGTSRVLTLSDLFEDERAAFRKEHRSACPGMATGRYFGARERPATAVVLLGVGPKKDLRLVVARPALSSWTFVELDRMDAGSTTVVSTGPATGFVALDGRPRPGDRDVVLLTAIDTWQRAYGWNGREFERLHQTD